ncbi:MAG: FGGY-family carbohydrate kinase [Thiohalocapsa sp.]
MTAALGIGLDIGTSGCRAVAINSLEQRLGMAEVGLPKPTRGAEGRVEQDPELWWDATLKVLRQLAATLDRKILQSARHCALCVDATSATLLLCAPDGTTLGPALMYNDRSSRAAADQIDRVAPAASAARGAGSSLAKLLHLSAHNQPASTTLALHQADWVLGRLRGYFGDSDWNNALKLGFDPGARAWPSWLERLLPSSVSLPRVHPPGTPLGLIDPEVARLTGLTNNLMLCAGTTDSTAAVIATAADRCGDAVTSLGSTLVLKLIAERPVTAPRYGVYSHRIGERWLIGGASNSGGAVLRQFFDDARIDALSRSIDPSTTSRMNYYPLPALGERFPVADPNMAPRLSPRPKDDAQFLHELFEGIARIERDGYARLVELGAAAPDRVLTTGGGARNAVWTGIRRRILGVTVVAAERQDAADGAALLALRGLRAFS